MKTPSMKIGTLLLLFFLVVSCVSKSEHEKVKKDLEACETKLETCESRTPENGPNINRKAFDIYNASYDTISGKYIRSVEIPILLGWVSSRGTTHDLIPKVVDILDFSSKKNYIVLEIYQHGQREYLTSLEEESRIPRRERDQDAITKKITNFKPSDKKTIFVVSLHDEKFDMYSPSDIEDMKKAIQEFIDDCTTNSKPEECIKKLKQEFLTIGIDIQQPRTVGGGVIPPGN